MKKMTNIVRDAIMNNRSNKYKGEAVKAESLCRKKKELPTYVIDVARGTVAISNVQATAGEQ